MCFVCGSQVMATGHMQYPQPALTVHAAAQYLTIVGVWVVALRATTQTSTIQKYDSAEAKTPTASVLYGEG